MKSSQETSFKAIVIGTSSGGFRALSQVLSPLPKDFPIPIMVVRHQKADTDNFLIKALNEDCQLKIKFAENQETPIAGTVYIAPPDQHLLVNQNGQLALSQSDKINFSRPSIDYLFKSAAAYYTEQLLGIVLTGANDDGALGAKEIKHQGGQILVQDLDSAEYQTMPKATLGKVHADYVVWLDQIGPMLWELLRKA